MTPFAIAALQLDLPAADNRDRIERAVVNAVQRFPWVQMVVLGELASFGPALARAEPLPGPSEERYAALARRLGIWLVPGTLYEKAGDQIYNTASAIDPQGLVVARHRKLYPFLPYEQGVAPGMSATVFDVAGVGRFGLSICYEQWFPEVARELAWLGAEAILHPTLTGTIDRNQELVLAQANAIANQCWFVDVNNAGALGNGRSIVVGPEGDVAYQAGPQEEVVPLVLDFDRVRAVRTRGTHGLGQPLKSFRDTPHRYACYTDEKPSAALATLGPLVMPTRARG